MSGASSTAPPRPRWTYGRVRAFVRYYITGVHTGPGRLYDLAMTLIALAAVGSLVLESVPELQARYGALFYGLELGAGMFFSADYLARIWTAGHKRSYLLSFWGITDLLAIVPLVFLTFDLAFLRILRVVRVFALLKLGRYTQASDSLMASLSASRSKIFVFLVAVLVLILVIGCTMHVVEPQSFPTIPDAIWWTVVTITTVGYGDFAPVTLAGRLIAGVTMILAFGIIAVPTGLVAVEMSHPSGQRSGRSCPRCSKDHHTKDANYCDRCGERLAPSL